MNQTLLKLNLCKTILYNKINIKSIFGLGGNFIEKEEAITIADALKTNYTLQKLDLGKLIYVNL